MAIRKKDPQIIRINQDNSIHYWDEMGKQVNTQR